MEEAAAALQNQKCVTYVSSFIWDLRAPHLWPSKILPFFILIIKVKMLELLLSFVQLLLPTF